MKVFPQLHSFQIKLIHTRSEHLSLFSLFVLSPGGTVYSHPGLMMGWANLGYHYGQLDSCEAAEMLLKCRLMSRCWRCSSILQKEASVGSEIQKLLTLELEQQKEQIHWTRRNLDSTRFCSDGESFPLMLIISSCNGQMCRCSLWPPASSFSHSFTLCMCVWWDCY